MTFNSFKDMLPTKYLPSYHRCIFIGLLVFCSISTFVYYLMTNPVCIWLLGLSVAYWTTYFTVALK